MFESLHLYNFVLVALNLIILYVVLRKILFKPVTAFMEKRAQSIKNTIKDAERQQTEAMELKLNYEEQLSTAKKNGEIIISEATAKASRKSDEILAKAKQDADKILKNARAEIEHEREQMLKDIHNQVVDLAIEAASKVMEAELNTAKNIKIVEKFLEEEGAA